MLRTPRTVPSKTFMMPSTTCIGMGSSTYTCQDTPRSRMRAGVAYHGVSTATRGASTAMATGDTLRVRRRGLAFCHLSRPDQALVEDFISATRTADRCRFSSQPPARQLLFDSIPDIPEDRSVHPFGACCSSLITLKQVN